ncbi:MAG TPA: hypothetical protein VFZ43_13235, partial [Anaerolineales bacterium]
VCETWTSGECTLRAAIMEANASPGTDTISFNIPGEGPHTISPFYGFDFILDPVIIDGTTQPGFSGTPIIELDGSQAGPDAFGLVIFAGSSTVRGLVINRFALTGIDLDVNGGNTIQGNYIGTDLTGTIDLGNGANGVAISQGSGGNLIGGTGAGEGNVVSGNGENGIVIVDPGSNGNVIQGNFIGTDITGSIDLGNGAGGVGIASGASDTVVGGTEATARNLISGNDCAGVVINSPGTTGTLMKGNFIGTDATGTQALGNGCEGVFIGTGASENVIGGATSGAGNLISGNIGNGITIVDVESTGNLIQGNFIGTDVTGSFSLGNADDGVLLLAPNNTIGGITPAARNVISGNQEQGIRIQGSEATGNVVQGNFIGLDRTGTLALGNGTDCCHSGVVLHLGASNNTIGGNVPGAGNVISANTTDGITIFDTGTTANVVSGNFIGTDVTGTQDVGNAADGIVMFAGTTDNLVGGTQAGSGNVISGNDGTGIAMYEFGTRGNMAQGNFIGTDLTGTLPLSNAGHGVAIAFSASDNLIGGVMTGAGNIIAFNNASGVLLASELSTANAILSNSIHSNGNLGIDLDEDDVTLNDLFDADSGSNNLQNFPFLNTVKSTGRGILIQGALLSTRNTTFRLEFFSNDVCDPSGYGEGQTYLGSLNVKTNSTGHVNFKVSLPATLPAGRYVTATATDAANNTSEFSQCIVVGP